MTTTDPLADNPVLEGILAEMYRDKDLLRELSRRTAGMSAKAANAAADQIVREKLGVEGPQH